MNLSQCDNNNCLNERLLEDILARDASSVRPAAGFVLILPKKTVGQRKRERERESPFISIRTKTN